MTFIGLTYSASTVLANGWQHYTQFFAHPLSRDVRSVALADDGSVWFATAEGAACFRDGAWSNYTPKNSGIIGKQLLAAAVDADGAAWFAAKDDGISCCRNGAWVNFTKTASGISLKGIRAIEHSRDSGLWAAGTDKNGKLLIAKYEGDAWKKIPAPEYQAGKCRTVSMDFFSDGSLVLSVDTGLWRLDGDTWHDLLANAGLDDTWINGFAIDSRDRIWLASWQGIAWQDSGAWRRNEKILFAECIAFDSDGTALIGTGGGGIKRFNGTVTGQISPGENELPDSNITDIALADDGTMWVCTKNGGAAVRRNGRWQSFTAPWKKEPEFAVRNLFCSGNNAVSAYLDKYGVISKCDAGWQTADRSGMNSESKTKKTAPDKMKPAENTPLILYDATGRQIEIDEAVINGRICTACAIDHSNRIWLGWKNDGFSLITGGVETTFTTENSGLVDMRIRAIAIDRDGVAWIGTMKGISRFDGTEWETHNCGNRYFMSDTITSIAIDSDNTVWFGAAYGGVISFDGNKWLSYGTGNSGLPGVDITAVAVDHQDAKWFAVKDRGVVRFSDGDWLAYTTKNGLGNNSVTCISSTKDAVWFGTEYGISKFIYK